MYAGGHMTSWLMFARCPRKHFCDSVTVISACIIIIIIIIMSHLNQVRPATGYRSSTRIPQFLAFQIVAGKDIMSPQPYWNTFLPSQIQLVETTALLFISIIKQTPLCWHRLSRLSWRTAISKQLLGSQAQTRVRHNLQRSLCKDSKWNTRRLRRG